MKLESSVPLDLAGRNSLLPEPLSAHAAVARILAHTAKIRQERLSGIHNPWGQAVGLTDPWSFLELCESDRVVKAAQTIIGPDVILWDSELFPKASRYGAFLNQGREGRYWPVTPLVGVLVLIAFDRDELDGKAVALERIGPGELARFDAAKPLYVVRLMPATSRFERDPSHPANRACMNEQVLINYANRPLWLLSGANRANNDLVSGFAFAAPVWAHRQPAKDEEK